MGEKLASYGDLRRRHIESLAHVDPALLARVDSILQEQFDRAKNILVPYREACTVLADDLASRLELSGEVVLDALESQDQGKLPRWSG